MDTKENYHKMIDYFQKEKKVARNAIENAFSMVDNSKESLEMYSMREVTKYQLLESFLKIGSLTEIVSCCETILERTSYIYWRIDGFKNLKENHVTLGNYVHKEYEKIKIVETLKIYRLSKNYLFSGTQTQMF